jgi:hypothetical protein
MPGGGLLTVILFSSSAMVNTLPGPWLPPGGPPGCGGMPGGPSGRPAPGGGGGGMPGPW